SCLEALDGDIRLPLAPLAFRVPGTDQGDKRGRDVDLAPYLVFPVRPGGVAVWILVMEHVDCLRTQGSSEFSGQRVLLVVVADEDLLTATPEFNKVIECFRFVVQKPAALVVDPAKSGYDAFAEGIRVILFAPEQNRLHLIVKLIATQQAGPAE